MSIWMKMGIAYLVLANLAGFMLMGVDKRRAKKKQWRIPEKTLFLSAIAGGSVGALYGMHLFRHKTKHKSFVFGIPAILIVQLLLIIVLFV